MHRNIARRVRNTPDTPPQRTGTAAAGSPRGRGGGIVRGAPSKRFGSSCASSSASHIASAAKPETSPRGRSSLMPNVARRRRACSSVSPAAIAIGSCRRGRDALLPPFVFFFLLSTLPCSSTTSSSSSPSITAPLARAFCSSAACATRHANTAASSGHSCGNAQLRCSKGAAALNAHTHLFLGPAWLSATSRETRRHFPHASDSHRIAARG
mmetsp:Transcript_480/g.1853  ORF Transcript_480/g.1853 Transcript_480/m.1853 type:complete len:211 (-) Transcript_480:722-1354(-)